MFLPKVKDFQQTEAMSLEEVMSEQMAAKISTDVFTNDESCIAPELDIENQDRLLALYLQQQEYDIHTYHKPKHPSNEKVSTVSHFQEYDHIIATNEPNIYNDYDHYYGPVDEHDDHVDSKQRKVGGRMGAGRFEQKAREKKIKKLQKTEMKTPTFEGIDGFSRKILYSLQTNQDVLSKINGCIAQGKEAVIHHAIGGNNRDVELGASYAVKIYKTTKVEFRDREQYIEGEWRFRDYQVVKYNPRKMIILWAEKELRNLKRLCTHGIPCPVPILLRKHILVMSFIGKEGYPAPQLENARLTPEGAQQMYWKCATYMRKMYQNAGLVHADLSPYNLLVYEGELYFIDLAQAVTTQHAHAPEFLRRDCYNMTKFFRTRNMSEIMSTRELFDFITTKDVEPHEEGLQRHIQNIKSKINIRGNLTRDELAEEQVWLKISLPTNLKDVTVDRLLEEGVYFSSIRDFTINDTQSTLK